MEVEAERQKEKWIESKDTQLLDTSSLFLVCIRKTKMTSNKTMIRDRYLAFLTKSPKEYIWNVDDDGCFGFLGSF